MARNTKVRAGQPTTTQAARPAPMDMDHLDRQTLGDPGLREEVLRLYSSMSGVYLGRIQQSGDLPALLENLHTLKSAAAGIGAVVVHERARDAEEIARHNGAADPASLLAVATAVVECQVFIHGFISTPENPV
ncbi:MAG: Hpt domain-containing protein [Rubrivivax sp.]